MMTEFTLRGGSVVTPNAVARADVAVSKGKVVSLGSDVARGEVIDVTGLLVFPGMVDTHVHLMDPGATEREDFPSGTRAAAARGVTTLVEHTHAHPVRSRQDLESKRRHLADRSNVDFGLAAHVWPADVPHLADLWEAGITFFKIFTCTTHGVPGLDPASLLRAFREIARFDGRCLVHCEDESITAASEEALRSQGRDDSRLLIEWRSREAEHVAVAAASVLAMTTGVKATLAHVSNPVALDLIDHARRRGADLAAEVCPQYLAFAEDEVVEHGPFRKFTPPARVRSDDERDAMWAAVRSGSYSHISTDHAPSTAAQKSEGSIWDAPFGLPGLDTTFPFFLDAALSGQIDVETLARLYAAAPAERYGLSAAKGRIDVGVDADLVLVDPGGRWTVEESDLHSKAGWSPFEGHTFRGSIVSTFLRGDEIASAGVCHDRRTGRFLDPRQPAANAPA